MNLFYLQVVKVEYRNIAQNRTLAKRSVLPPRGIIYDRNEKIIVENHPSYELEIIYSEIDEEIDVSNFCSLLNISEQDYVAAMENTLSRPYFQKSLPISFLRNIDPQHFAIFQEHLFKFPGFYPIVKTKRNYPHSNAAQVLGFISEVNSDDLKRGNGLIESGEYKGASGVERSYDPFLRGNKGLEYILRDNLGKEIESFKQGELDTTAIPGGDLYTTLDIDLQALGEKLLLNKKGSIVAILPENGEILSMVSSPSYDPNLLAMGRERNKTFLGLLTDTINRPLLNRSLQAKYPPGSIFKPILSLIALQEGITYEDRTIKCSGEYVLNREKGYIQGCRDHPTPYNIEIALQHSCNTYYYQVLREFIDQFGVADPSKGLALLNGYLNNFGLGRTLGVDLGNEISGYVPTPEFYNDLYNTNEYSWRSTYILSLGIGQGELEFTTLQMANLASILANRGNFITPHVIKNFRTNLNLPKSYVEKQNVGIDSIHFIPVIEGMEKVISSGTGYLAYVPGIDICGKTGTSQNPHGKDHSVFFAFAPKYNPKIAIAVYVENAGGGGAVAAPIGGLMIESYLLGKIRPWRKNIEQYITGIDLIHNEIP